MLIGFIGSGKIAQALIKGFTSAGICRVESILASAPKEDYTNHYKTRVSKMNQKFRIKSHRFICLYMVRTLAAVLHMRTKMCSNIRT